MGNVKKFIKEHEFHLCENGLINQLKDVLMEFRLSDQIFMLVIYDDPNATSALFIKVDGEGPWEDTEVINVFISQNFGPFEYAGLASQIDSLVNQIEHKIPDYGGAQVYFRGDHY